MSGNKAEIEALRAFTGLPQDGFGETDWDTFVVAQSRAVELVARWDRQREREAEAKAQREANNAARKATTKKGGVVAPKVKGKSAAWHRSRSWVMHRANGRCEAHCAPDCEGRGSHAHHVQMRSQGGSDGTENLLWLCPPCHRWVHDYPEESYAAGWLVRSGALAPVEDNRR